MKWLQTGNRLGNVIINGDMKVLLTELIESFYLVCKDKRRKNKSTLRRIGEVVENNIIAVDKLKIAA